MKVLAVIASLCIFLNAPCEMCGATFEDNAFVAYHQCETGEHFGTLCQECRENVLLHDEIQALNHEC